MKIEQIYTGCLSQATYIIHSKGEAAIIDPLRDIKSYLSFLEEKNLKLKFIFETHFHADFVSGHIDLKKETNADIVFGPNAKAGYDIIIADDQQVFPIGDSTLTLLHTPGHTLESSCFLLKNEDRKNSALFTGDTLFLGDVGRPDLAVKSDLSAADLAAMLYKSLNEQIMPLEDDLIVYPGHGAGSSCGKNLSKETSGLLGQQKKENYALQAKSEKEFIDLVLDGQTAPPEYFPKNALLNQLGYEPIDQVIENAKKSLKADEFEQIANQHNALVIDVRAPREFAEGFVPRSINIGLNGQFATWMATLNPDLKQPILLVCNPGSEEEAISRLTRVGYDNILGFLEGGVSSWASAQKDIDTLQNIEATEFAQILTPSTLVMDVRGVKENLSEHLLGDQINNHPLDEFNKQMTALDKDKTYYIHCAGGYRSSIAASILKSRGIHNIIDVVGGFNAIKQTEATVSAFVCPSTL